MDITLYLPDAGYYTNAEREPWKDYTTSPETHPAFGMLLANQIIEMDHALGRPIEFTVLEPGAGQGLLAIQIMVRIRQASPDLFRRLRYLIVEINPHRKKIQQRNLVEYKLISKVRWLEELKTQSVTGCVVANELLDSFPVHLVQLVDDEFREIFVTEKNGKLETLQDNLSTVQLSEYFQQFSKTPPNIRMEINLKSQEWISEIAKILSAGYLLIMDYGYQFVDLRLKKYSNGTLTCYHNHTTNNDPFCRIGYQDITSHVNFTALMNQGRLHGLETREFTTQKLLLEKLGMKSIMDGLLVQALTDRKKTPELTAAKELINSKGLGRIKVLMQSKQITENDRG